MDRDKHFCRGAIYRARNNARANGPDKSGPYGRTAIDNHNVWQVTATLLTGAIYRARKCESAYL